MRRTSGSGLFLLEIMISILFFVIAAAVCAQVFVRAHLISKQAENLTYAQSQAATVAEVISGDEDPAAAMSQFYGIVSEEQDRVRVFFGENWELCEEENAGFVLCVDITQEDTMRNGQIRVSRIDGEEIYSLRISRVRRAEKSGI